MQESNQYRRPYFLLVGLVALWCSLIVAAPLAKIAGGSASLLSSSLYSFFSGICHQLDQRSFHIAGPFGDMKFGVCIRCCSIYGSFLVSLLFLPLLRDFPGLRVPNPKFLFFALLPMLLDVVLSDSGIYPSSSISRIVTGILLGSVLPLYVIPPYLEAVSQLRHRSFKRGDLFHAG